MYSFADFLTMEDAYDLGTDCEDICDFLVKIHILVSECGCIV